MSHASPIVGPFTEFHLTSLGWEIKGRDCVIDVTKLFSSSLPSWGDGKREMKHCACKWLKYTYRYTNSRQAINCTYMVICAKFLNAPVWHHSSSLRHFTKKVNGINDLDYPQRLRKLGLPSLEYRRMRGDLIETYKITHNIYDPITTKSLFTSSNITNTRSHFFKLTKRRTNTNQY